MIGGLGDERGQALAEVAICLPLVLLLALGAVAVARVADARGGLDAATGAAAQAAARAPDAQTANKAARAVFSASIAPYGLSATTLTVDLGTFARGGTVTAAASARLDDLPLVAHAAARIEPWRSR